MDLRSGKLGKIGLLWVSIGLSLTFLFWVLRGEPDTLQNLEAGLKRYGSYLIPCLTLAGFLLGFFRLLGVTARAMGWIAYISSLFYIGFLKVIGWNMTPWVLLFLGIILMLFFIWKKSDFEIRPSLLLFHGMGTISGLYLSFHLNEFLMGWPGFQDMIQGLWTILSEGIVRVF